MSHGVSFPFSSVRRESRETGRGTVRVGGAPAESPPRRLPSSACGDAPTESPSHQLPSTARPHPCCQLRLPARSCRA
jgi:hypothetical protein